VPSKELIGRDRARPSNAIVDPSRVCEDLDLVGGLLQLVQLLQRRFLFL